MAIVALLVFACQPAGAPAGAEEPPPTSVPQEPIGAAATPEAEVSLPGLPAEFLAEQDAGLQAPAAPALPPAATKEAEEPVRGLAEAPALPLEVKTMQVERGKPGLPEKLPSAQGRQVAEQPVRQGSRDFDLDGRAMKMLSVYGVSLDAGQERKLKGIAAKYDFGELPAGEERQALRREFMSEVFDKVLTGEQQEMVREKRSAGRNGGG